MKLLRFSSLALAAALALPAIAQAQVTLTFDGVKTPGGDMVGSAATGAYQAHQTLPTVGSSFDIYCIDFDHHAQNVWQATYLTFAQATDGGVNGAAASRQLGTEKAWGIQQLRAAAYLSTTFGSDKSTWDDVHGAIWSMFSTSVPLTSAMTTLASNAVANHGNELKWDAGYALILDTRAYNQNFSVSDLNQGFITEDGNTRTDAVVPEPSTYALMGAGLLAVGFVRRRRRSV